MHASGDPTFDKVARQPRAVLSSPACHSYPPSDIEFAVPIARRSKPTLICHREARVSEERYMLALNTKAISVVWKDRIGALEPIAKYLDPPQDQRLERCDHDCSLWENLIADAPPDERFSQAIEIAAFIGQKPF